VRRALNYAVDREAIVEASGGADRASPSCQIIPANFPGYREYCPYERDLDTARRLVAASGTKVGYPARLELVDDDSYFEDIDRAGLSTIQAGDVGFGTSFPSTAELVQSLLGFLEPLSRGPDPAVERAIRRAFRLQETDAIAANDVWARVDRLLVDRALLVPLYNFRVVHVISERAGNHQVHPYWDVLLDQMWVR
jgi:peptide/nickel transport system substrate-binding protein